MEYRGTLTNTVWVYYAVGISLGFLVPSQNMYSVKTDDIYFFTYLTIIDQLFNSVPGRMPGFEEVTTINIRTQRTVPEEQEVR